MKLKQQGLGLQLANIASQVALNKSQAEKNKAEADKIAKNNQKRNKDLWDYTNYENQKQHIKNAGLNPALMYGMGGGGGVSASGAHLRFLFLHKLSSGHLHSFLILTFPETNWETIYPAHVVHQD